MHNVLNSKDAQTLKQQLEAGVLGCWVAGERVCLSVLTDSVVSLWKYKGIHFIITEYSYF